MSLLQLCVLGAVALARVGADSIRVSVRGDSKTIETSGSDSSLISEIERHTFGIEDYDLRNLVRKEFGKRPDNAYVRGPTLWGDLYKTYNWDEIKRTLSVTKAEVLSSTEETVVVDSRTFENNSTSSTKYKDIFFKQVLDTVTHTWNKTDDVSGSIQLNYAIRFPVDSNGASLIASYKNNWGKPKTVYQPLSIGDIAETEFQLPPGTEATVSLVASRGVIEMQVNYEAGLKGDVAINYGKPFKGHHFWKRNIDLLTTKTFPSSENIQLTYYTNAKLTVQDNVTKKVLSETPVPINLRHDFHDFVSNNYIDGLSL